jgi:hypothetical protein
MSPRRGASKPAFPGDVMVNQGEISEKKRRVRNHCLLPAMAGALANEL